ncbi:chymase-like [Daktulosphaira vitifoliae]|uniref:chymase-like n=1 Tax=Daktulosphaira vitifoliae TaxID=58002 RepID=UPI0021AADA5B|nr:chymase-like [Daktulosphaira vitifoliae]
MKSYLLTLNVLVCLISLENVATSVTKQDFVASGKRFDPMDYPYVVGLRIRSNFRKFSICTGTLVAPVFVLTAGHCTHEKLPSSIKVYHGSPVDEFVPQRSVRRIYSHVDYNHITMKADISIIQIYSPFNVHRYVKLSGHPGNFENYTELKCNVLGFGQTQYGEAGNMGYITRALVRYGPKACKDYNKHNIPLTWPEYLCSKPDVHMICPGDSGGPMICRGFQYGIASHGYDFHDPEREVKCGSATVQTRHLFVYPYKEWINEILSNESNNFLGSLVTVLISQLTIGLFTSIHV